MINKRQYFAAAAILALCLSCAQQRGDQSADAASGNISFQEHPEENKVDVLVDGKLFTSYRWPENVFKPVLYPILSAGGNTITRGFPLETREGERTDHRHQVGNWLNYGNVNGFDFWGNGHSGKKSPNGGVIEHVSIESPADGTLLTRARWVDPAGTELLSEKTEFHFSSGDAVRVIDRITTLTAKQPVTFADTKEGMFGLRVARELELPSNTPVALTNASGQLSENKEVNNEGVTGNYRSSEGLTGEAVWGTRAKWMSLSGSVNGEEVAVLICDHPRNTSYPTWWHARGYGLFSANPLGAKDFTKGETELNFALAEGDSVTFRYRIAIVSGAPDDEKFNTLFNEFSQKY